MSPAPTGSAAASSHRPTPQRATPAQQPPAEHPVADHPARQHPAVLVPGLLRLLRGSWEQRGWFIAAVIGAIAFALLQIATSAVIGRVTQGVIVPSFASGHPQTGAVVGGGLAILGIGVLRAAAVATRRVFASAAQFDLFRLYRRRLVTVYERVPLLWHRRQSTGTLLSSVYADVEATFFAMAPFPFALATIVMLVYATVVVARIDAVLLLVMLGMVVALIILNIALQRFAAPIAIESQRLRARVAEIAHESFDGGNVVKSLGREDAEEARFTEAAEQLRRNGIRFGYVRGWFDPVIDALPNLGILAVALLGAWRIGQGHITTGQIVEVSYLFTLMALPIRSFGWVLGDLSRTVVGGARVQAILDVTDSQDYGTRELPAGPGRFAMEHVDLVYRDDETAVLTAGPVAPVAAPARPRDGNPAPGHAAIEHPAPEHAAIEHPASEPAKDAAPVDAETDAPATAADPERDLTALATGPDRTVALHDVTLVADPAAGSRVLAVVGATGSGKSTLALLAARLIDPTAGSVTLDGADLRELTAASLAEATALVLQQAFIFDDTVRENITLGRAIDEERIRWALRIAQAETFVDALPEGLDTVLGERGGSLSGGQRQRIALARALVRRPRLLILDDATSACDPSVEAAILEGIRTHLTDATLLLIAYRKSTIAIADRVVLLERGRVRAEGTHEDLRATCAPYRALVDAYDEAAIAHGLLESDRETSEEDAR